MTETSRWISVGDLRTAFSPDSNTAPPTEDLAGQVVELYLEDGQVVVHEFEPGGRLSWKVTTKKGAGRAGKETYYGARVREGIYFVDFVKSDEPGTTITLVLDLGAAIATVLVGRLPDEAETGRSLTDRIAQDEDLTAVSATFLSAALDTPFGPHTPRHAPTDDLLGWRVEYTYSSTERYEHVYLNEEFYTWHCLSGSEKGLADTDRCHYYKLGQDLYFFVWREKIVPTLGAVVVDFAAMRTMGKIFGYQGSGAGESPTVANFPVGARARLLSITSRD